MCRFGIRLEQLRHQEMELRYDLNREDCEAIILLKGARKKYYTAAEAYKDKKCKELDEYRKEVRTSRGEREGWGGRKCVKTASVDKVCL